MSMFDHIQIIGYTLDVVVFFSLVSSVSPLSMRMLRVKLTHFTLKNEHTTSKMFNVYATWHNGNDRSIDLSMEQTKHMSAHSFSNNKMGESGK